VIYQNWQEKDKTLVTTRQNNVQGNTPHARLPKKNGRLFSEPAVAVSGNCFWGFYPIIPA
jgi:hypothetical protein